MSSLELIGKEGFGIAPSIFTGERIKNKLLIGGSGHPYIVTVTPEFVRIMDAEERRLRFTATVDAGGVLKFDIQSFLFRDDHKVLSPDLFIGRLYSQALLYFDRMGTQIARLKHDFLPPVEEEGIQGDSIFCPNVNFVAFGEAVHWDAYVDDTVRKQAAHVTWSGRMAAAHGFSYHSSTIIPGYPSIGEIHVSWVHARK